MIKREEHLKQVNRFHDLVESIDDKIIVNNYGHGGSGWTLGPGAAKYVISLLQQQYNARQLSKNTPLAVIGAGAIGLFTALELNNQGYTDITIYAENFDDLPVEIQNTIV